MKVQYLAARLKLARASSSAILSVIFYLRTNLVHHRNYHSGLLLVRETSPEGIRGSYEWAYLTMIWLI